MTGERATARLRLAAHLVLAVVAAVGAVLSWVSLYEAASGTFGPVLAAGFPLLVDALVLGASLAYVAGARRGRARAGWRITAHAAIAATLVLNALAAGNVGGVPWHVTAPAVWAVLVELYAREALGDWRAEHAAPKDRIPARLWLTAPVESARTWLRMGRTGATTHAVARVDVGVHAAAVEAMRLAIGGWSGRRVRRVLRRQLRAGSLPASAVLEACGWSGDVEAAGLTPEGVLRRALGTVLAPAAGGRAREPRSGGRAQQAASQPAPGPMEAEVAGERRPVDVDALLLVGQAVAEQLQHKGERLTRSALIEGLHERGHAVSTTRATELLRQLKAA